MIKKFFKFTSCISLILLMILIKEKTINNIIYEIIKNLKKRRKLLNKQIYFSSLPVFQNKWYHEIIY